MATQCVRYGKTWRGTDVCVRAWAASVGGAIATIQNNSCLKIFIWDGNVAVKRTPLTSCPPGMNHMSCHLCVYECMTDCEKSQHVCGVCFMWIHLFNKDERTRATHRDKSEGREMDWLRCYSAFRMGSTHNPVPWEDGSSWDWQLSKGQPKPQHRNTTMFTC